SYQLPGGPRSLSSLGGGCTGLATARVTFQLAPKSAAMAASAAARTPGWALAALARRAATTAALLTLRILPMSAIRWAALGLVVATRANSSSDALSATATGAPSGSLAAAASAASTGAGAAGAAAAGAGDAAGAGAGGVSRGG